MAGSTNPRSEYEAAVDIQRAWRGHGDRKVARVKAAERHAALRAHIDRANFIEACVLIQTRMRIVLARARRHILHRHAREAAEARRQQQLSHQLHRHADPTDAAALNIQRTWRGHHDRKAVSQKVAAHRAEREEYFAKANLFEACLVIQTRMRIVIAKLRRRKLLVAGSGEPPKETSTQQADVGITAASSAVSSDDNAAAASAVNIQRAWRGHEGRKRAGVIARARDEARRDHFERANLLESCVLIQTRMRIVIAKIRRRRILQQPQKEQHCLVEAVKNSPSSASSSSPPPLVRADDQSVVSAATNIQRAWRGHEDRNRVREMMQVRQLARKEYLEKANLLEACVMIQTRMRIVIAKMRRRIALQQQQRSEQQQQQQSVEVAPPSQPSSSSSSSSPPPSTAAATVIQRNWRGHGDRQRVRRLRDERNARHQEYLAKANLLEACVLIQSRMRIALAKTRLRILERTRRGDREQQQQSIAGGQQETVRRPHLPMAANTPAHHRGGGAFQRSAFYTLSASPPSLSSSLGHHTHATAAASAPVSASGSPSQRHSNGPGFATSIPPQQQQGFVSSSAAAAAAAPPAGAKPASVRPASAATRLQMYSVPAVARSGFYVRTMDESTLGSTGNPYQQQQRQQQRQQQQRRSSDNDSPHSMGGESSLRSSTTTDSPALSNPSERNDSTSSQHAAAAAGAFKNFLSTAPSVLDSAEEIATFAHRISAKYRDGRIPKSDALCALMEVCSFGGNNSDAGSGDLASVIVRVWDGVVPFARAQFLTATQMQCILSNLRSIKRIADLNNSSHN